MSITLDSILVSQRAEQQEEAHSAAGAALKTSAGRCARAMRVSESVFVFTEVNFQSFKTCLQRFRVYRLLEWNCTFILAPALIHLHFQVIQGIDISANALLVS